MAADRSVGTKVSLKGVARPGRHRADERAAEQDLARLERLAMGGQFVGQPGDGVGRMPEYAGRQPRLFDLAIAQACATDPGQVDVVCRQKRPVAHDQAAIAGVTADAVDDGPFLLGDGVDLLEPRVEDFDRRTD